MSYRHAIIVGVALGVTAALVVWFLERFEKNKLHTEVRQYLSRWEEFNDWLSQKEGQ